jgi:hypothetical protein
VPVLFALDDRPADVGLEPLLAHEGSLILLAGRLDNRTLQGISLVCIFRTFTQGFRVRSPAGPPNK